MWLKTLRYQCTNDAALPRRLGEELDDAFGEPHTGVGDDQPDAMEAAALEVLEERAPACLVLFGPFADTENLPITLAIHGDRHQQRHVANLARPTALEHDAVQVDVRVLALDQPVAPGLDGPVDLLVEVRHCRGR